MKINKIQYDGETSHIFKIWISNWIFTILTLGIYYFWGKVKILKYKFNSISLLNERLEFIGTGKQLFLGFLRTLPLLLIILGLKTITIFLDRLDDIVYLIIYIFWHYVSYRSIRYYYSHITWKGIRGNLEGAASIYALKALFFFFIKIITLWTLSPWLDINLRKNIINNSTLGNVRAKFIKPDSNLISTHFITWLLAIPTLGISRIWYRAALLNYINNGTHIDSLKLNSTYTGFSLLSLYFFNFIILICTLGLGTPFMIQRNIKYTLKNLTILGEIDSSKVTQTIVNTYDASSEALAEADPIAIGF